MTLIAARAQILLGQSCTYPHHPSPHTPNGSGKRGGKKVVQSHSLSMMALCVVVWRAMDAHAREGACGWMNPMSRAITCGRRMCAGDRQPAKGCAPYLVCLLGILTRIVHRLRIHCPDRPLRAMMAMMIGTYYADTHLVLIICYRAIER